MKGIDNMSDCQSLRQCPGTGRPASHRATLRPGEPNCAKGARLIAALARCMAILGAPLVISACATAYKPPPTGTPTASVKFIAGSQLVAGHAKLQDNPDCKDAMRLAIFGRATPNFLSDPEFAPTVTKPIPATGTQYLHLYIDMGGGMFTWLCDTTVAFDPVPDGSYEVVFDKTDRGCSAGVYRLDPVTGNRARERTARSAPTQCRSHY